MGEQHIDSAISLRNVSRTFENRTSLKDISIDLNPGDLCALIGPGDAGKTAILYMILGIIRPESGDIRVFGEQPGSAGAMSKTGAVLERMDFPPSARLREIVDLVRGHFDDPVSTDDLLRRCRIDNLADRLAADMNHSQRRWLAIALSLVNRPSALIMDSPMLGMDVGWRDELWNLLAGYAADGGVALITTDVLHEVETYASRVVIMHSGRIVDMGTVSEVVDRHGQRTVSMAADSLPDVDGLAEVERCDGRPRLYTSDSDTLVQVLREHDANIENLKVRRPSLEDVVLSLIKTEENGS
jgi:ABC-2 type transport system ATP-binding protein